MINITLHFETVAEAQAALERMYPTVSAPAAAAQAEAAIEKAAKPAKVSAPKPVVTPSAPPESEPTPSTVGAAAEHVVEDAQEPTGPTYDDVARVVLDFIKAQGKPAAIAKFESLGLKSLPAAKPEQFASILAAFEGTTV